MEGQHARCECPPYYLRTIPGIFKMIEMALTILVFALSFGGDWWGNGGHGWVEFAGISSFITITVWFILHLVNLIPHFLVNYFIEFVSYVVMAIFLLIAGIISAVSAKGSSTLGACAFFSFAATAVCAADAVLQFLEYRRGTPGTTTTTVTTTTTSSTSAHKVEY